MTVVKDSPRVMRPQRQTRSVGSFKSPAAARRYWIILLTLLAVGALLAFGLVAYGNPMEYGTRGFWLIAKRRSAALVAMIVVAVCQSTATVAFHTVTNNRIITPSIMGFESLYVAINTSTIFFLGAAGLTASRTVGNFLLQMVIMVGLSLLLYSWLLTNRSNSMHARLFGSVNNAETEYYPIAIPLMVVAAVLLYANSRTLNVVALGRDAATNLGVSHKAHAIYTLVLVSVLMAVTTALVGPMTFLGFLVATLAYQFAETFDHRYLFPMATAIAFVVLAGAYFLMQHVFNAQGVVSIIIELVGGSVFLFVILRKGRL